MDMRRFLAVEAVKVSTAVRASKAQIRGKRSSFALFWCHSPNYMYAKYYKPTVSKKKNRQGKIGLSCSELLDPVPVRFKPFLQKAESVSFHFDERQCDIVGDFIEEAAKGRKSVKFQTNIVGHSLTAEDAKLKEIFKVWPLFSSCTL